MPAQGGGWAVLPDGGTLPAPGPGVRVGLARRGEKCRLWMSTVGDPDQLRARFETLRVFVRALRRRRLLGLLGPLRRLLAGIYGISLDLLAPLGIRGPQTEGNRLAARPAAAPSSPHAP